MKHFLLVGLLVVFAVTGFSQNVKGDKLFKLSEVYSSDFLEYEKYAYNEDLLLHATDMLTENGDKLIDTLSYDEFNNIVKLDIYQHLNGTWTYVSFIDYTYDENGNRLTRSNYNSFGTPNFTLGGVYHYFYNEDNQQTHWELYMGGTDLMQLCTLTYNDDGQVVQEIGQDAFMGTMEDSWKIDYQYNSDGTLMSSAQSFWNGSSWTVSSTELFYYDDSKNCTTWEHKSGNTVTDRKEYEYNMAYTIDQLVTPVAPEFETKNLVAMNNMVTLQHWYAQDDAGNLVYVCDYIYNYDTLTATGITNHPFDAGNLRMYPNPTSDLITIAASNTIISNVDVIDNTGKVVIRKSHLNKEKVNLDLTTLKSGIYYVRLATSKGMFTERLIVQ
jgi:hypothetical protein